ncbi:hypothetical protein AYY27_03225 [Photobacterium damselae]|uniref:Uncharacterized protein n=1 Tax=Photobacterium damselae TaxID=38293 RepID=A0ABD6X1G8_PHODM|nr:hypothetical protein AYY27_03225 [Photobacterium damselae]PSU16223.1 hypothetical protein CTM90_12950 [Photobacterium damselae]
MKHYCVPSFGIYEFKIIMINDCDKIANTEKDCFRKDTVFDSYLMIFKSIFKNTQKNEANS